MMESVVKVSRGRGLVGFFVVARIAGPPPLTEVGLVAKLYCNTR